MSRIITTRPPVTLFKSSRLVLSDEWDEAIQVPFYADNAGLGSRSTVFTFVKDIIVSGIVTNPTSQPAYFSARILSSRMSTYVTQVVSGSGDGSDRIEFKGFGVAEDNIGGALDNVRLFDLSIVNKLINGSFEDTTGLQATGYGFVGIGSIPGWTDYVPDTRLDLHKDTRNGVAPSDGDFWLDTRGNFSAQHPNNGNIHIYQDVADLAQGQTYQLLFDFGDDNDRQNELEVYWNGELLSFNGVSRIPAVRTYDIIKDMLLLPAQSVRIPLEQSVLQSNDRLQLRANTTDTLVASLSYVSVSEPNREL